MPIVIFRIVFFYLNQQNPEKKWKIRNFRKFKQKKMIFEAKKKCFNYLPNTFKHFCAKSLLFHGQEKAKLKIMPFFLSCTQHLKNRKNRKPRKRFKVCAHICPTCRYVRPCISLNTFNWPLKLCEHILEYIYSWFMGKKIFPFFGPYKTGPCLKTLKHVDKQYSYV